MFGTSFKKESSHSRDNIMIMKIRNGNRNMLVEINGNVNKIELNIINF